MKSEKFRAPQARETFFIIQSAVWILIVDSSFQSFKSAGKVFQFKPTIKVSTYSMTFVHKKNCPKAVFCV